MGFTVEQQAVIDARESNVLVSAAAGSGKTTVLVERIIQRITGDKPIDIDRLLVVTFTKAAAAQMKEKILKAIQDKLVEEPDNAHLQRQETLVHGAQITTIDSFCQYVIRNNFNEINLDPSYRVGDEGEMKLLRGDVLEELLEEKYAQKDPAFLDCTEYFATGKNDKNIETFLLKLYDYAMSMPFPEEWLEDRKTDYNIDPTEFDDQFFVKRAMENAINTLKECEQRMSIALAIANEPDGPYVYGDVFESELEGLRAILSKENREFDDLRGAVLDYGTSFKRLPGKSDPSVNIDKREAAKKHRGYVKDQISKLATDYFSEDRETIIKHMEIASEPVRVLAELAIEFKHRFDEKKREMGIIDFDDMEHLALNILVRKNENGEYEPSGAALQYRDFFEEVMIDEYQDSNNVQELLLSSVSGEAVGRYNRFMVGDVKQSIYKFRLACPEIFMEKMATYELDEKAPRRKISLHNNFRSRRQVLDSVNYIFEQIMGQDLGGVKYDEDAALVTGAGFPAPEAPDDYDAEYLFANVKKMKSQKARELEGRMVAQRIDELMKTAKVKESDDSLRPVRYSDIVILLRATSGWDDVFKKALDERGIPVYIESKTGYFSATEVVTLLNVLKVLSNPMQDIPLVSVMHSAIGDFNDEELAIVKAYDQCLEKTALDDDSFYSSILRCIDPEYKKSTDVTILDDKLSEKLRKFANMLELFREKSSYLPVSELLKYIMNYTGFYEYCAALPAGEIRAANLNMLIEKAVAYEQTSFKGLFHFVRYIEQLSKYEVDFGEAGMLDEHADVVRIMSIHKSKGLEFPIVFVSGMSKEFNYMDTNSAVVCDMDMGIGTHAIDLKNRVKYKTLRKNMMDDSMKKDTLGEEMRILYVAMTRAKEKLIMTGQINYDPEAEKIAASDIRSIIADLDRFRKREALDSEQPYLMPLFQRETAKSYQQLVLMSLVRHPDFKKLSELVGADIGNVPESQSIPVTVKDAPPVSFSFRVMDENDLTSVEQGSQIMGNVALSTLNGPLSDKETELMDFYMGRFAAKYPHEAYNNLFIKTTVTELKKAQIEESEPSLELIRPEGYVPSFINGEELAATGAARGTIYHKVMELIYENDENDTDFDSFSERLDNIAGWFSYLDEKGRLLADQSRCVKESDIRDFCESDAGIRMKTAMEKGLLHRESPFMMGISARRVDDSLPEGEIVLIQGIIDVWFEEEDGLVLLDYKTDKVRTGDELIRKYKVQLDYYQEALEKITNKKVKERLIYSFTLNETIPV